MLTKEEREAIKRGNHPVSKEAMDWATSCLPEIDAAKAAGVKCRPFSEFRAELEARGLVPPRKPVT